MPGTPTTWLWVWREDAISSMWQPQHPAPNLCSFQLSNLQNMDLPPPPQLCHSMLHLQGIASLLQAFSQWGMFWQVPRPAHFVAVGLAGSGSVASSPWSAASRLAGCAASLEVAVGKTMVGPPPREASTAPLPLRLASLSASRKACREAASLSHLCTTRGRATTCKVCWTVWGAGGRTLGAMLSLALLARPLFCMATVSSHSCTRGLGLS
jgi:hypothetical protein